MELVTMLAVIAVIGAGFVLLGLLADEFGVDSRPTVQDDWRRAW
jgi:hypothetical protein